MNAEIGRCIFQRDFRQAMRILLRPYNSAPTSMIAESWDEALKIFQETENIDKAIDIIPRSERENTPKGRLLVAVKHFGFTDDGCLKAICDMNTLHKNMTVQAYVNEEWNRLVSERVLRSGTYPTISDWVQSDRLESQEQCDQYSMTNLTLPIFGTQFLDNEHARALYEPIAKSAGISLEDFELPRELGITFRGWHRPMFTIPQNLSYTFEEFEDTTHLVLDFRLPPSCYATVMLEGLTGVHEDS